MSDGERGLGPIGARLFLMQLVFLTIFVGAEVGTRGWIGSLRASEEKEEQKKYERYASLQQLRDDIDNVDSPRHKPVIIQPHRYIGFIPRPNLRQPKNYNNSLGFRGDEIVMPKPEGEFRIVCTGGSTTYTTGVEDPNESYPELLERVLHQMGYPHVQVINGGMHSWSSFESMMSVQFRVLDLDPDMVIVYHGVNDIHPRLVWPPEAYQPDNSGRRQPVVASPFFPPLYERSAFLRYLLVSRGITEPHSAQPIERILFTEGPKTSYHHRFFADWLNDRYPGPEFQAAGATVEDMLDANPPIWFERNLNVIASVCEAHDVDCMFATFAYSPRFPDARSSSPEYQRGYAEGNAVMTAVGERRDVPVYDFAADMPPDEKYWEDGRHVLLPGSRLKARLFGKFLVDNALIPGA